MPFPYLGILKEAYEITWKHRFLWVFGLFIGGTSFFNFGSGSFLSQSPGREEETAKLKDLIDLLQQWIGANSELFTLLVALFLGVFFLLIILQGLAKAAVIWAVAQERSQKIPTFKNSLRQGKLFFWRIVGLQILVTAAFFAVLIILAAPVVYLFANEAFGRAVVLFVVGLAIFIPTSLVFGFVHLYGPIFIVLFDRALAEAARLSFNLLRRKLKESLILSAFLIGLSLLFLLILSFSIIIFATPLALLGLLLGYLKLEAALVTLVLAGSFLALIYFIALAAAFAVFQNVAWVLAVKEMIRTQKIKEEKEALAAEPA